MQRLRFVVDEVFPGADSRNLHRCDRLRIPLRTNLAASFDVTQHWSVYGRIGNLFDHRYENPVGFLQPSRAAYAGIKARF